MFRRVQEAMADVAETLRRTFRGVAIREEDPRFLSPALGGVEGLKVQAKAPLEPLRTPVSSRAWRLDAKIERPEMAFQGALQEETGWEAWGAGSRAIPVPFFKPGQTSRLEVPALPRKAVAKRASLEGFRITLRTQREPLRTPGVRKAPLESACPRVIKDLERTLRRPCRFQGQAFASLPKALQMRYTVQLVKATGENIRDLEVVGLFRVPRKGLGALRLDPRNGGLMATLALEAVGAPKDLLLLAKRKVDQALLPCFLESP